MAATLGKAQVVKSTTPILQQQSQALTSILL